MLTTTLTLRRPLPEGARVVGLRAFPDGRALALARRGGFWFSWVDDAGLGPPIKRGDTLGGDVCARAAGRLFLGLDGEVDVFDDASGAPLGAFVPHDGETFGLTSLPHERLITEGADGRRRLWCARTLTRLGDTTRRRSQGLSTPLGLLPGDPTLTTRSSVRQGRWTSALVSLHTGRDVLRVTSPCDGAPAHHMTTPCPDSLEWAGVICSRVGRGWGPSRIYAFGEGHARLLDEEPSYGDLPGIVRVRALTADWLYTEGWRDPQLIHLRTGERRASARDGEVSASGLMLCREERAVTHLETGAVAPLYAGTEPEPHRRVLAFDASGAGVWVATETTLELWRVDRD